MKCHGKVNPLRYSKSRIRYVNEETDCERCGVENNVNMSDHLMRDCKAISASPITFANEYYPFSLNKRLRAIIDNIS